MENESLDVIIVGAGIAGLTAAKVLKNAGKKILVIEASDGIGGRVRSDHKNGFILDRGFQVLLTAYPAAKELLDYKRLNLKPFKPGALIMDDQGIWKIGDPSREPRLLLPTLFSPVGNFKDKILLLKLKAKLSLSTIDEIFSKNETTTLAYLIDFGFSEKFMEKFFRPFFTGIFLESKLETSSRMFEFLFKMFGEGSAAVPALGMGMISEQMAENLKVNELALNEHVTELSRNEVKTASGTEYKAKAIIIATTALTIPTSEAKNINVKYKSAVTFYFSSSQKTAVTHRIGLNANANQLINNIAFMDHIAPNYAPKGQSLISVSIKTDLQHEGLDLEIEVRKELMQWYPESLKWKLLAKYDITYALPDNRSVKNNVSKEDVTLSDNLLICGDHLLNGSINAAMESGKAAANAVLAAHIL